MWGFFWRDKRGRSLKKMDSWYYECGQLELQIRTRLHVGYKDDYCSHFLDCLFSPPSTYFLFLIFVLLLNSFLFSFPLSFNIYFPCCHYYQAIFHITIALLSLSSPFALISLLGLFLLRFLKLSNTWNMARGSRSSTGHVAIAISLESVKYVC